MKMNLYLLMVIAGLLLSSASYAQGNQTGGGDILCEAQIKKFAPNIQFWLEHGGPETGPLDLSSSHNPTTGKPYTFSEYETGMTELLKKPLIVSCVDRGDPEYPVAVEGARKVCKSWIDAQGMNLLCQEDKVLTMMKYNPAGLLEQFHHEYAIHVPGLEPDDGPVSSYTISNQLSEFGEIRLEYTLAIKPKSSIKKADLSSRPDVRSIALLFGVDCCRPCEEIRQQIDDSVGSYFKSHGLRGEYAITKSTGLIGCEITASTINSDVEFAVYQDTTKGIRRASHKDNGLKILLDSIHNDPGFIWDRVTKDGSLFVERYKVDSLFFVPKK